jgi:hypothetical protein
VQERNDARLFGRGSDFLAGADLQGRRSSSRYFARKALSRRLIARHNQLESESGQELKLSRRPCVMVGF